MAFKKLIYYLIPLIVLILVVMWQFGPEGLFEGMKEAVTGVVNITIGAEELTGEKPTIPEEHRKAIRKLVDTIKGMVDSERTNCFANYGKLPDLGEEGTSISFQLKGDKTVMVIGGGAGGKQEVSYEEIEGFKPCVIAGPENTNEKANDKVVAENFYDNFLRKDFDCAGCDMWVCPEGCDVPYWTMSKQIIIKEKETIVYDGTVGDFEDGGWLYKNNNGYICFFPTVDGDIFGNCDGSNADGLDDDCLGEDPDEDISIPRQVREEKLITC